MSISDLCASSSAGEAEQPQDVEARSLVTATDEGDVRPVLEKAVAAPLRRGNLGKHETLLKTQQRNVETATKSNVYAHLTARDQKRLQQLEAAFEGGEVDPRSALAQEFRRQDKKDCMKTSAGDLLSHCRAAAYSVCPLVPGTRKHTTGVLSPRGQRFFQDMPYTSDRVFLD